MALTGKRAAARLCWPSRPSDGPAAASGKAFSWQGNFPHEISVNAALLPAAASDWDLRAQSLYWPVLLAPQRLKADWIVEFAKPLANLGRVSHVRVNIHPDGGLSRVRIFGRPGS